MVYRVCLAFLLICCSGCVTTAKTTVFCNKTIDLDNRPMAGKMDVGIKFEFFKDWSRK